MLEDDVDCNRDERARLDALHRYQILDTPKEQDFDDVAALAAEICGTPIAVVNLIADKRQFFKAEVGLGVREIPLETSFCARAILEDDFLEVPDATKDDRFQGNPLVTGEQHLRFYAGAILKTSDGMAIGTVCVLDREPRVLTDIQRRTLAFLARQVMTQLELRRVARSETAAKVEADADRARYKAIFESATDYAIVVLDRDGIITDWNTGANRILGWSSSEIVGSDVSRFFTPEDREIGIPQQEMDNARKYGRGMDERWHLRKSGERFWANGEMMPLVDAEGLLKGYVKILRDRTGERLAKQRLEDSERRWRELFETMREGFFLADLVRNENGAAVDYRFLEINPAFFEQTGLGADAVGRTYGSIVKDVPRWLLERYARTVDDEPQNFEIRVPDLNRWFEVRSKKHSGDRFSCLFFDVTSRKLAEQNLALSDERLKMSLVASGGVGLWDWMLDTDLLHGDANFARMYGLDEDAVRIGVTMEEYQKHVVSEDIPMLRDKISDVFNNGADFDVEYRIAVPGKPVRWVECKGRIVEAEEGRARRFSGTAVDITKLKDAERQKQLLMEEMAHRVKNTFSVVQAIASQSLRTIEPETFRIFLRRLTALASAHDILLQTEWASTPIVPLMQKVLAMQAEASRFVLDGDDITVGSKTALSLSMLLHEMATNAVKYGALSVDDGHVRIRWLTDNETFHFEWEEVGGPAAAPPTRKGFGSRLIKMGISGTGRSDISYRSDGLHAFFEAPSNTLDQ